MLGKKCISERNKEKREEKEESSWHKNKKERKNISETKWKKKTVARNALSHSLSSYCSLLLFFSLSHSLTLNIVSLLFSQNIYACWLEYR
jgi:hypothetical protein